MTRDEILALEGRELDAAVAERVMGWVWMRTVPGHVWGDGTVHEESKVRAHLYRPDSLLAHWGSIVPDDGKYPRGQCSASVPHYSTDIAAAWKVVTARDWYVSIAWSNKKQIAWAKVYPSVCPDSWDEPFVEVEAPTPELAICRAALLAVLEVDK